ncbi:class I SAM-dependent methyltransferase [Methylomonas sp. MED-D]|uniref:SAM-dependent methyltransferase n=2 Tax=Methylomonas TaxID=416 RepID=A0A177NTL6_9GAMM|nr:MULTISPECIES: class I SAM-dependent methyltransferase [Methylomonas]MDT4330625.1 class I SAM-dependent methyltransferase [Methylomonas sp. MV1]NJA06001.1 class I SAM-dependent methyltransferase [Methylococcaceae bacterium WWC4]OAI21397.1 hypothetical protein A1355_02660 [Methylomonas koyamae]OHX34762.1 hypothetical protein BJL95_11750 [Methylomonas sp. LWB]
MEKLFKKIKYLPELAKKYRILKHCNLLDDRLSASELEQYLYTCSAVGTHRGYLRSLRETMCVDREGNPLPWYTYPAIEQLAKWDFSEAEVFEFGCGNSTRWWAGRSKSVVSLEGSRVWYDKILSSNVLPDNTTPILVAIDGDEYSQAFGDYAEALNNFGQFDVIIVDGESRFRTRYACANNALKHLRAGGLIILDNSDWHPESAKLLRDSGLLQIDFCGLGPLNTHAETTSLFLDKFFSVKPVNDNEHPGQTIGGLKLTLG